MIGKELDEFEKKALEKEIETYKAEYKSSLLKRVKKNNKDNKNE